VQSLFSPFLTEYRLDPWRAGRDHRRLLVAEAAKLAIAAKSATPVLAELREVVRYNRMGPSDRVNFRQSETVIRKIMRHHLLSTPEEWQAFDEGAIPPSSMASLLSDRAQTVGRA
jgi:hypothetical protein